MAWVVQFKWERKKVEYGYYERERERKKKDKNINSFFFNSETIYNNKRQL